MFPVRREEEYLYRAHTDSDDGIHDLAEMMCFELYEFGVAVILEPLLAQGLLDSSPEVRAETEALLTDDTVLGYVPEEEILAYCKRLVGAVSRTVGKEIRYGLWLTDREWCVSHCADGQQKDIRCYPAGDVLIFDLAEEGRLYGYPEPPEPIM